MIALAAIIALALLILRRSHTETQHPSDSAMPSSESETAQSPPAMEAESQDKAVSTVQGIFSAPIEFYGRVMDQHREPVADAEVEFGAANHFMASSTKYWTRSDGDGYFSITGIQGAALNVYISKDGYDTLKGQSDQSFGYGMGPDSNRKSPPKKSEPAIFVLRKMAVPERLVRISSRQYEVSKDGTPMEVNLETGKAVAAGKGHLRVECWLNDQAEDDQHRFDWKCRISVPGGGLVERDPQFAFEAPEDGYRPAEEIIVRADNLQQPWSSEEDREYFLKLADGKYARLQLSVHVGSYTMIVLESYFNPSGSRNLEYDPKNATLVR